MGSRRGKINIYDIFGFAVYGIMYALMITGTVVLVKFYNKTGSEKSGKEYRVKQKNIKNDDTYYICITSSATGAAIQSENVNISDDIDKHVQRMEKQMREMEKNIQQQQDKLEKDIEDVFARQQAMFKDIEKQMIDVQEIR